MFLLEYCRDFGPRSSALLFPYRGSCYSLTSQAVTWSEADNLCQNHFYVNTNKNKGSLTVFEDAIEFNYVGHVVELVFNRSAIELGAYIGFYYRNSKFKKKLSSKHFHLSILVYIYIFSLV